MLAAEVNPMRIQLNKVIQKNALVVFIFVMKPNAKKFAPNNSPVTNTVRSMPIFCAKCVMRGTVTIDVSAGMQSSRPVSEPFKSYSRASSGK